MTNPSPRPAPVYLGFADSDPDLYEFRTDTGVYVYLHELACVGLSYLPLTRTLTVTFDGGPTDLVSEMTVTLTFTEAEVYHWQTNGEPLSQAVVDTLPRARGQVGAFHTERQPSAGASTAVSFHLSLLDVAVSFFATDVICEVREGVAGPE